MSAEPHNPKRLEESLREAIKARDPEMVKRAIEAGANIEEVHKGDTPLMQAALVDVALVKALLAGGANINNAAGGRKYKNANGEIVSTAPERCALHVALANRNTEILEYLISQGADLNIPFMDDVLPVCWAIHEGEDNLLNILIQGGADLNAKGTSEETNTPLQAVVIKRRPELIPLLIEAGANPNGEDLMGSPAVHFATISGSLGCLEALLANGALVNLRDMMGRTPLMLAARNGFVDEAMLLLEHGADPLVRDGKHLNSLKIAIESDNLNVRAAIEKWLLHPVPASESVSKTTRRQRL